MKTKLLTLLPLLCGTIVATAAPLQKGDALPDVTLRNENNEPVQLRKLVAEQPTVLIFYRGGWCPFCNRHLSALVEIQDELKAAGFQMLAISMDQPAKLKETPRHDSLGYALLSDSDATAADAFGIVFTVPEELVAKYKNDYQIDLEAAAGRTHHKLPHPSVFVVGQGGIVQFAYVNEDYKVRLEPKKILEAARASVK